MASLEALKSADAARLKAMIDADVETLGELLHDDLRWTHSSGRTDDRSALMEIISSGAAVYKTLDVSEPQIQQQGTVYIYSGIVEGDVEVGGTAKRLKNKFLSVWIESNDRYQLLAWQSTGV